MSAVGMVRVAFGDGHIDLPSDCPLGAATLQGMGQDEKTQQVARKHLASSLERDMGGVVRVAVGDGYIDFPADSPLGIANARLQKREEEEKQVANKKLPSTADESDSDISEMSIIPSNLFKDSSGINDVIERLGMQPLTKEEREEIQFAKDDAFRDEEDSAQNLALARIAMKRNDTRLYEYAVPHLNNDHLEELKTGLKFFLNTLKKVPKQPPAI